MLNHESTLPMPDYTIMLSRYHATTQSFYHAITLSFYHAMVGAELVFARHTKTTDFHIICGQRQDYDPTIDTISGARIPYPSL